MTRNLATFWRGGGGPRRRHPLADGTTVILTPSARRVGALLRARDLDLGSLRAGLAPVSGESPRIGAAHGVDGWPAGLTGCRVGDTGRLFV